MLGPHTHTPAPAARGWRTPTARPAGGQSGEGWRLASDAPRNGRRHPPRGRPPATPTASNARAHAVGPVLGPHTRTDRTRDTRVAEPWLPAPEDGQSGEGQRLTSDAPHHGGRCAPLGDALPPPPQQATPARKGTRCGAGAGPPRPHRPRPGHVGHGTLAARPRGPVAGGGTAPNTRRPSQCWKAPPPGTPISHPHNAGDGPDGGCERVGGGAGPPDPRPPHGTARRMRACHLPREGGRRQRARGGSCCPAAR